MKWNSLRIPSQIAIKEVNFKIEEGKRHLDKLLVRTSHIQIAIDRMKG